VGGAAGRRAAPAGPGGVLTTQSLFFAGTHPVGWGPVRLELPDPASLRPLALAVTLAAAVMVLRLGWSVPRTLGACAVGGVVAALAGLPLT
jgi:chromate transporter